MYSEDWKNFQEKYININCPKFCFWIFQSLFSISQKNTLFIQCFTFYIYWRGISARGISLLSKYGLTTSFRSLLNYRKKNIETINYQNSVLLENNFSAINIDNYNKFFIKYNIKKVPYSMTNWTGIAFTSSDLPIIPYNSLLPVLASSDNFSLPEILTSLNSQIFSKIILNSNFQNSNSISYPPQPENNRLLPLLKNYHPYNLQKENVGADSDLEILLENLQKTSFFKNERYTLLVVDYNIFIRCLKRFVGLFPAYTWFSKHICLLLGSWHPYKVASECIWRTHLYSIIAPLMHSIFPKITLLRKPRLGQMHHFFSILLLSYPNWKSELYNCIEKNKESVWISNLSYYPRFL